MAIGRISGEMLLPNLERDGVDLAIETDLLYFDVVNKRIGIKTSLAPVYFNGSSSCFSHESYRTNACFRHVNPAATDCPPTFHQF